MRQPRPETMPHSAAGLPTTIEQAIRALLGNVDSGPKGYDMMTPTRYMHAVELLERGADPGIVDAAVERIGASGWLKKPALQVTEADLEQLRRDRPWEKRQQELFR